MTDFKQARAVQTRQRSASLPSAALLKHGRQQTSRTEAEQAAHEDSYGKVYMQRARDLLQGRAGDGEGAVRARCRRWRQAARPPRRVPPHDAAAGADVARRREL